MRFRLVDEIIELRPGVSIVARTTIDPNADYFADHFPGHPVVPGVLQVEMMAQSAGKCLMSAIEPARWPVLIQIRSANFRKSVPPGAELAIEATIVSTSASTASATASIKTGGATVSDATLVFGFIDKTLLAPGFRDEVLAAYERRMGTER